MSFSAEEYARYILTKDVEAKNIDKIEASFNGILDEVFNQKSTIERQDKQIEILEEQVSFRNNFIEQVLEACNTLSTKKELVKFIKNSLEQSYIEL
jgi:vacuolar-type H+-ATPase subunit I/STV1